MTIATWIAILVLGPGSVAVFVFFVRDLKKVMGTRRERRPPPEGRKQGPS